MGVFSEGLPCFLCGNNLVQTDLNFESLALLKTYVSATHLPTRQLWHYSSQESTSYENRTPSAAANTYTADNHDNDPYSHQHITLTLQCSNENKQ